MDPMLSVPSFHQTFARRKGRSLRAQAGRAFKDLMPRLQVPVEGPIPDISSLFSVPVHEVWLEIGFGGGEHLASQLAQNPTVGMIGCEPFINGVARLLTLVDEVDLGRLRLLSDDVRLLLKLIPDHSLDRVFILFPDPWPKTRHHKRRLIQSDLLDLLQKKMRPGGILRIASDDHPYVAHIMETLEGHEGFLQTFGARGNDPSLWTPRPESWPRTRYETKAINKGIPCAYMEFICR